MNFIKNFCLLTLLLSPAVVFGQAGTEDGVRVVIVDPFSDHKKKAKIMLEEKTINKAVIGLDHVFTGVADGKVYTIEIKMMEAAQIVQDESYSSETVALSVKEEKEEVLVE